MVTLTFQNLSLLTRIWNRVYIEPVFVMTNHYEAPPRYLCRLSCGFTTLYLHNLLPFPFFHARGPAIFILIFLQLKIYLINISDYEFYLNNYVRLYYNIILVFKALFFSTLISYGWVWTWLCLEFDSLFSYIKPAFSLLHHS